MLRHWSIHRVVVGPLFVSPLLLPSSASALTTLFQVAEVPSGGTFFDVSINNQGHVAYWVFVPGTGDVIGYGDGLNPAVEIVPFVIGIGHMDDDDQLDMTVTAVPAPALLLLQTVSLMSLARAARSRRRA